MLEHPAGKPRLSPRSYMSALRADAGSGASDVIVRAVVDTSHGLSRYVATAWIPAPSKGSHSQYCVYRNSQAIDTFGGMDVESSHLQSLAHSPINSSIASRAEPAWCFTPPGSEKALKVPPTATSPTLRWYSGDSILRPLAHFLQ